MSAAWTLGISRLAELHPELALIENCATQLILRLSVDPTAIRSGERRREVRGEHRPRHDPDTATEFKRLIEWEGLSPGAEDRCRRYRNTVADETLTEWAAIGMMALLIHDLEGGTVRGVVRQGVGGDYVVSLGGDEAGQQIEVRGIREDRTPSGSITAARVREKREQILRYRQTGFVSVTAFAYSDTAGVYSVLHFVKRPGRLRSGRTKRRRW